ncbi:MAG: hypothetical protein OHK0052_18180 [Anaerolineales bacterium]
MNQSTVKLTIRIPAGLHHLLQQRARERKWSLNTQVVESLRENLAMPSNYPPVSERERVVQVLRESGMISDIGSYVEKMIPNAPVVSPAELRAMLQGVPPLSDVIIHERNEGR